MPPRSPAIPGASACHYQGSTGQDCRTDRHRGSPTQVRSFFQRLGLRRRRVGRLPHQPTRQSNGLLHDQLEPRLKQAKKGQRVVLFVDAVHGCSRPFSALSGVSPGCLSARRRAKTAECVGSRECHQPSTAYAQHDGDDHHATVKDFLLQLATRIGASIDAGVGQCPYFLDARCRRCETVGDRGVAVAESFAEPQLDRATGAVPQEGVFVFQIRCGFPVFQSHILHELEVTPTKYRKEWASLLA